MLMCSRLSYRFQLPTPTSLLGLPIGQHISIGATITKPDGTSQEVVRSYTPISGDDQPGHFDLLVKSYPTGNISKHLAGIHVGQTIRVRGPKGAFVYTPNMVRHFGMVAGGTGITPMLQVVKAIIKGRAAGDKTEVDLIFANVSEKDILLREDLDALTKDDPGFRLLTRLLEMAPEACGRRQDPHLRSSPHGQRPQEDYRGPWVQEGSPRQQA